MLPRCRQGMTPLHYASRNGHEDIVQALLEAGADLFVADQFGATPSEMASDWQRLEILRMIGGTTMIGVSERLALN